jgi:hypothetical protein
MAVLQGKKSPFDFPEIKYLHSVKDVLRSNVLHPFDVTYQNYLRVAKALTLEDRPWFDYEWYEDAFDLISANAFGIVLPDDPCEHLRGIGTGIYPIASLINHSCVPNADWVFESDEYLLLNLNILLTIADTEAQYLLEHSRLSRKEKKSKYHT